MTASDESPELRLALPEDLPKVAPFLIPLGGESFAERFGQGSAEDFYRWKYFRNPLGDAVVAIAIAGGAVVSVVAAAAKRIWMAGKVVLAYELGDFLTDEKFRKRGLFSRLIELACAEVEKRGGVLVYVRPNENSFPILVSKLGFQEVQRLDARRFVVPSYALARKAGVPAGLLRLTGMDWITRKRCIPKSADSGVPVVSVERFDTNFDQLWHRAAAGYDFSLVRDSSYLNWRFAECPTPYRMWRAERGGQGAGILVASLDRKAPVGAIVDLFAESGDEEAVRALLAAGLNSLLESGVRQVSTWTLQTRTSPLPAAHRLLQKAIPMRRKQYLHLAFRVLRKQQVTIPPASANWQFTLGDCDGA